MTAKRMTLRRQAATALLLLSSSMAGVAHAETLQGARAKAYRTNPTLLAQRANQRALDETIVQARAGLRPTVSASNGRSGCAAVSASSRTQAAIRWRALTRE